MDVLSGGDNSLMRGHSGRFNGILADALQPLATLHEQRLDHSDVEKEQRDDQSQRKAHGDHHGVHKTAPR